MPRRFFRKFAFKRQHLSELWFMSPFKGLLQDHRLWGIRRRTVVPAFSLGLFVAFLPMPGHTLLAALLALLLRVNVPVAALSTWVSNPVTIFIMYPGAYQLGSVILDAPARDIAFDLSWDWLTHTFVTIWQPMLLGSVLLGAGAALLGYIGLDLLWRASIADYKSRKREIRSKRNT